MGALDTRDDTPTTIGKQWLPGGYFSDEGLPHSLQNTLAQLALRAELDMASIAGGLQLIAPGLDSSIPFVPPPLERRCQQMLASTVVICIELPQIRILRRTLLLDLERHIRCLSLSQCGTGAAYQDVRTRVNISIQILVQAEFELLI